jgi:ADP-heptose:LPS heptosyltransferase
LKVKNNILVINPCLVGDFVVSLPALHEFIRNNKKSVIDLVVSPPLKTLAEKIRGVNQVFVATSSTTRDIENGKNVNQKIKAYKKVVIMRISENAYRIIKKLDFTEIINPLFNVIRHQYIDPVSAAFLKRSPKQRREIDFSILNQQNRDVSFREIFQFKSADYKKIYNLPEMKTRAKIIIVHTGPVWIMRKWENNKWVELLKKINSSGNFRFIFVGTGTAEKDFKEISKKLDFKTYSLINKIDLKDLMLVIRNSNYLIGVDSGPRNMAHLVDTRSITLFGPAASGAIYMPWSKKDIVIDKSNGGGAYEALFYKRNSFISKIGADEVFEAFKKLRKVS